MASIAALFRQRLIDSYVQDHETRVAVQSMKSLYGSVPAADVLEALGNLTASEIDAIRHGVPAEPIAKSASSASPAPNLDTLTTATQEGPCK